MLKQIQPKNICIVRLSAIGDVCHALAVARSIQKYSPEISITWIIGKTEADLIGDIPDIEFIIFDKTKGIKAYREVSKQLKGKQYDIALCMHASLRANFIYRLIPTSIRLGFDYQRARDLQWIFTNCQISSTENQHVLDAMHEFATEIGVNKKNLNWNIPISEKYKKFASQYRIDHKPMLIISPCSSQRINNYRNWNPEYYAASIDHAHTKYDCKAILTGSSTASEKEFGDHIVKYCKYKPTNLIGKTNIKELLAIISESDLLICPDSGPAHIATAVGTPVIGLYASSNPDRTGPYYDRELTINLYPLACETFAKKSIDEMKWGERIRHPNVMNLIKLDQVIDRIDQAFKVIKQEFL